MKLKNIQLYQYDYASYYAFVVNQNSFEIDIHINLTKKIHHIDYCSGCDSPHSVQTKARKLNKLPL